VKLTLMAELNVWLVRTKLAIAVVLLALTGVIAVTRGIARLP
jgi:TRAP-type mannitol/chloroaromatic compound transport system permease small subunit